MARRKKIEVPEEPFEAPWDLPDNWRWARIQEISAEPVRGEPASRFEDAFRYLDVGSINGRNIHPKNIAVGQAPSRARQFVALGDTVLSGVRVYLRNMTLIEIDNVDVVSTAFCVIRPSDEIDPKFLFRWVNSDLFINSLIPLQRGNSPPAVLDSDVRAQPIPVPPLQVQQAIVARTDTLFAEIDEGEAALADALGGVETYGKSLLKAAVTGELTADWRRDNPPQESGSDLLERILTERHAKWGADHRNAKKKYSEPVGPVGEGLPGLPEGWVWTTAAHLTTGAKGDIVIGPFGSDLKVSDYRDEGVPLVFVRHIRANDFEGLRPQFVTSEKATALKAHEAISGDLLITKMGDPPGDVAMYLQQQNAIITADCIRWRPTPHVDAKFLEIWLRSFWARAWIEAKTKGVAQQKITLEIFRQLPIALPSLVEQQEIVELVIRKQSELNEMVDRQNIEAVATLRQSILAAAFRGELTA